jgi:hypothetical protein
MSRGWEESSRKWWEVVDRMWKSGGWRDFASKVVFA